MLELGSDFRVMVRAWLLFYYSSHTIAIFSLWIRLDSKDNKLSTTPRPRQLEAKARARDFCPRGVLKIYNSPSSTTSSVEGCRNCVHSDDAIRTCERAE